VVGFPGMEIAPIFMARIFKCGYPILLGSLNYATGTRVAFGCAYCSTVHSGRIVYGHTHKALG